VSYAIAGLVLVAVVTLVNALLTLGVVKRWRTAISAPPRAVAESDTPTLAVQEGERTPAFTLHTPHSRVTEATLAGHPTLIAFLRPDCGPTTASIPEIARWAEANTPSGAHLVAVINGEGTEAVPLLEAVGPITELTCTEGRNGPIAQTFGVQYHPSFVLLDADGTVTETGIGQGSLPALNHLTV
jgi:hypothetical protein